MKIKKNKAEKEVLLLPIHKFSQQNQNLQLNCLPLLRSYFFSYNTLTYSIQNLPVNIWN